MTSIPDPADPRDAAACHAVLVAFLAAIDHGQASSTLELFTPDACIDARGHQLCGSDQIEEFLAGRETEDRHTAHLVGNCVAHVTAADELELTALLFLHERQSEGHWRLERVLDTTQVFRRTRRGWRIHRRTLQPLHPPMNA